MDKKPGNNAQNNCINHKCGMSSKEGEALPVQALNLGARGRLNYLPFTCLTPLPKRSRHGWALSSTIFAAALDTR